MKIRLLLLSLILGLVVAPGLRAQAAAPKPVAANDEEETELEGKMDRLSSAYKRLRRQIADPSKNEDSLKRVAIIRASGEAGLKLTPAKAADLPEADRPKFMADFQAKMKSFLGEIDKLEAALKANDNAGAQTIFAGLKQIQKNAHKQFQKEKPKK